MWLGVTVGFAFALILAAVLRAFDVGPQRLEAVAFTVSMPVVLISGAIGGLLGSRRDQRKR